MIRVASMYTVLLTRRTKDMYTNWPLHVAICSHSHVIKPFLSETMGPTTKVSGIGPLSLFLKITLQNLRVSKKNNSLFV